MQNVTKGDNDSKLDKIVGEMIDHSILTESKMELLKQKRRRLKGDHDENVMEDVLIEIDKELKNEQKPLEMSFSF